MADLIGDMESSLFMADESARKLREKKPEHPLLKFSREEFVKASPEEAQKLNAEMQERFWNRSDAPSEHGMAYVTAVLFLNYDLEMKKAIEA